MDVADAALEFHIVFGTLSPAMAVCQVSTSTDRSTKHKSRYFNLEALVNNTVQYCAWINSGTDVFRIDEVTNEKLLLLCQRVSQLKSYSLILKL